MRQDRLVILLKASGFWAAGLAVGSLGTALLGLQRLLWPGSLIPFLLTTWLAAALSGEAFQGELSARPLTWRFGAAVIGGALAALSTLALFAVMRDFGRFEPSYLLAFFFGGSRGNYLQAAMFFVLDWGLVLGVIALVDRVIARGWRSSLARRPSLDWQRLRDDTR